VIAEVGRRPRSAPGGPKGLLCRADAADGDQHHAWGERFHGQEHTPATDRRSKLSNPVSRRGSASVENSQARWARQQSVVAPCPGRTVRDAKAVDTRRGLP
jgi:hypothetical protein